MDGSEHSCRSMVGSRPYGTAWVVLGSMCRPCRSALFIPVLFLLNAGSAHAGGHAVSGRIGNCHVRCQEHEGKVLLRCDVLACNTRRQRWLTTWQIMLRSLQRPDADSCHALSCAFLQGAPACQLGEIPTKCGDAMSVVKQAAPVPWRFSLTLLNSSLPLYRRTLRFCRFWRILYLLRQTCMQFTGVKRALSYCFGQACTQYVC
jgi:hypothetical protein